MKHPTQDIRDPFVWHRQIHFGIFSYTMSK